LRNTEIQSNEESHTPTSLRHRENIGRIGSLRVYWGIGEKVGLCCGSSEYSLGEALDGSWI
tara:strand:+ start:133 stop:315 length:183 start_codon:yes stop_codon:yes gene_type:complete